MTDRLRLYVTGYRWEGTIVTLFAHQEDGTALPIHGDWRPMREFLTNVALPTWVQFDPGDSSIYPDDVQIQ